jgi:hypothetical protein
MTLYYNFLAEEGSLLFSGDYSMPLYSKSKYSCAEIQKPCNANSMPTIITIKYASSSMLN